MPVRFVSFGHMAGMDSLSERMAEAARQLKDCHADPAATFELAVKLVHTDVEMSWHSTPTNCSTRWGRGLPGLHPELRTSGAGCEGDEGVGCRHQDVELLVRAGGGRHGGDCASRAP